MFVFWYCHKRGKETRLAKAAEGEAQEGEAKEGDDDVDDGDDIEAEYTDEEAAGDDAAAEKIAEGVAKDLEETLQQPEPAEVSLPDTSKGNEAA